MPTYDKTDRFQADWEKLDDDTRERFRVAVVRFIEDLGTGQFRKGLRVKRVQGTVDVWELTFAPEGRATWQYGEEVQPGEPHVVGRRIGTHSIFNSP